MPDLLARPPETRKQSGTLSLHLMRPGAPATPYVRFKVCRGFIDDLNRLLPIRARIELETRIAAGAVSGEFQLPQDRYRWEFHAE